MASVDDLHDHEAMSWYATITAVAESPLVEGLLYVGTDDGLVQVSEDGGATWRRAAQAPDLPERAFVNDLTPSRHDPDGVYLVADDHKSGDYRPLVYESRDRGRTWRSVVEGLPERTIAWCLEQDHEVEGLLFLGAEHGLWVSLDGGGEWRSLSAGLPTIAIRDLALQRRDGDLVAASFGRGIHVLDDYSPLRTLAAGDQDGSAVLHPVRRAWWYVPHQPMQAVGQPTLGSTAFRAPNPPFGATFTYQLTTEAAEALDTAAQVRRRRERADAEGADGPRDAAFPGWDTLWEEHLDTERTVLLVVRDADGNPVRQLEGPRTAGLHRVSWDLRRQAPDPVTLVEPDFRAPWDTGPRGPLVEPGTYRVELVASTPAGLEPLDGPRAFEVEAAPVAAPGGRAERAEAAAFRVRTAEVARRTAGVGELLDRTRDRLRHVRAAAAATAGAAPLRSRVDDVHRQLEELDRALRGSAVRRRLAEPDVPSVKDLVDRVAWHHWGTTGPATATQHEAVEQAAAALAPLEADLRTLIEGDLAGLVADLDALDAPWTPR